MPESDLRLCQASLDVAAGADPRFPEFGMCPARQSQEPRVTILDLFGYPVKYLGS